MMQMMSESDVQPKENKVVSVVFWTASASLPFPAQTVSGLLAEETPAWQGICTKGSTKQNASIQNVQVEEHITFREALLHCILIM